jgi:broad specificity polyphosphatase/5'/3'-nucleotidase SurE
MATNIIYDRIFKGLKLILGRRAVIEGDLEPKAAEFIRLSTETSPELIENTGASYAMLYSINIDLVTNRAKRPKYITQALANIIRLLNQNTAYTTGGVYYWHDGAIITTEPGTLLDEDGQVIYAGRILWTATHTELK